MQDPDNMHPIQHIYIYPFNKVMHGVNSYAQQPVPRVWVVLKQDEQLQDVMVQEGGYGGMIYLRITPPFPGCILPPPPLPPISTL